MDTGQLRELLELHTADVLFLADAKAPASQLLAAHSLVRETGRRVAFIVQRKEAREL